MPHGGRRNGESCKSNAVKDAGYIGYMGPT